jgi:hypothetical protein
LNILWVYLGYILLYIPGIIGAYTCCTPDSISSNYTVDDTTCILHSIITEYTTIVLLVWFISSYLCQDRQFSMFFSLPPTHLNSMQTKQTVWSQYILWWYHGQYMWYHWQYICQIYCWIYGGYKHQLYKRHTEEYILSIIKVYSMIK